MSIKVDTSKVDTIKTNSIKGNPIKVNSINGNSNERMVMCLDCQGKGVRQPFIWIGNISDTNDNSKLPSIKCKTCKGTGKVSHDYSWLVSD